MNQFIENYWKWGNYDVDRDGEVTIDDVTQCQIINYYGFYYLI